MVEHTFTQLTAPGVTSAVKVDAVNSHVFQIKLANKDTSVDVNIEGTIDGTNYFSFNATDTQYTANGTYLLSVKNMLVKFVRFRFVSEVGGAAATLDVIYQGSA